MTQMVQHLSSKCEAPSSIPSSTENKETGKVLVGNLCSMKTQVFRRFSQNLSSWSSSTSSWCRRLERNDSPRCNKKEQGKQQWCSYIQTSNLTHIWKICKIFCILLTTKTKFKIFEIAYLKTDCTSR
jgi:hypothetical protein